MRWTHIVAALAFAATAASTAAAQSAPPVKLIWERTPTIEDVRRVYPHDAWQKGIAGGAMIGCDVAPDGALQRCKAYAEEPANMGFGDAAVNLAAYLKLKPGSFDHALPVPGRIALPIILATPGHALPKLAFKLGDSTMLLGNANLPHDATAVNSLGCLTLGPPHGCTLHFMTWAASPNTMTALGSVLRAGASDGGALLICWVKPDGGLTDCQASTPAGRIIADDLAPDFKAPRYADDRSPIGEGPIMISLKWSALSAAAQALKGDVASAPVATH